MNYNPEGSYTFPNTSLVVEDDAYKMLYYHRGYIVLQVDEKRTSFVPVKEGELDPVFEDEENPIIEGIHPPENTEELDRLLKEAKEKGNIDENE